MKRRRKRIFRGVVLAFAIAAFAVPTAQARPLSKWNFTWSSTTAAAPLTQQQLDQELRFQGVDKQQGLIGRTTTSVQSASLTQQQLQQELRFQGVDKQHGLVGRTTTGVQSSSTPPLVASSSGFDWGDAFAGAAATFATVIVLVAGFTAMRRREQPLGV